MTVSECIRAYVDMSDKVFRKVNHRMTLKMEVQARFDTPALESAIKDIIERGGLSADALLMDDEAAICKV